ncbi:NADH flavin oxidoreductase/12-oxophytodienoate reductase [Teratosphaeria nubilosa]|uniref:NADH flavin oxidoreductase/12-oxophytodienoate reductase n=1 Tax=Teratosphaeria nubilosa TaxID=161662 RepID=A0A6G1LJT9_9PEZI|nr:NADH flavin oxidoreductase/12-oxophytodienoate reductase [Teratosphaeria nubilosa]
MSDEPLFKPLRLGHCDLKHHAIMAPLTKIRSTWDHTPGPCVKDSPQAGDYNNVPGIWNEEQAKAWKDVTNAVHGKGSFIFCQLWALGRIAGDAKSVENLKSSSAVAISSEFEEPKELSGDEIQQYIKDYANVARNAIAAGFNAVEIHGANGYLIDQFWQDKVNRRNDKYGGARFALEATKAKKVSMRLSTWSTGQGMRMQDPVPQSSHIVSELKKLHIAYLHLVESRTAGTSAVDAIYSTLTRENDSFVELWSTEAPIILAGGFDAVKAKKVLEQTYTAENVCIAFGRYCVSNPDLPFRWQKGLELQPYERKTFYRPNSEEGYTTYAFSERKRQRSRL